MEAFGQNIDFEFETILTNVINLFLIPKFNELGMKASGEWEENIEAKGNEIWGRDYTEYLTKGRPPNESQNEDDIIRFAKWASATFIGDWVEDKGLDLSPFAVAYKIAKEGTKRYRRYPKGSDLLEVLETPEVRDYINTELSKILIRNFRLNVNIGEILKR